MKHMEEITSLLRGSGRENQMQEIKPFTDITSDLEEQSWEMVMDKKHFKLWRRPIGESQLYQYRGSSRCGLPSSVDAH